MSEPGYHSGGVERMRADGERLSAIERELERLYARWETLEARVSAG